MDLLKITSGSLLLILLLLGILWKVLLPALLRWRGVVVDGYVFDRSKYHTRYGVAYYLKYSYHYGKKGYTRGQKVDEETYHIWSEGGDAQVRCLPLLPFLARLEV